MPRRRFRRESPARGSARSSRERSPTWSSSTTTWRSSACSWEVRSSSLPEPSRIEGASMLGEIREQPSALLRLVEHDREFARVAELARSREKTLVRIVGHGSSDNAASYGVYAFGLLAGWTALRDSISLTVYSDAELEMGNSLVLALSQSGRTPDVLEYVARSRAR